jgi:hypothetical protein
METGEWILEHCDYQINQDENRVFRVLFDTLLKSDFGRMNSLPKKYRDASNILLKK